MRDQFSSVTMFEPTGEALVEFFHALLLVLSYKDLNRRDSVVDLQPNLEWILGTLGRV